QEPRAFCKLSTAFRNEIGALAELLDKQSWPGPSRAAAEALLLLSDERVLNKDAGQYSARVKEAIGQSRQRLEAVGEDWRSAVIESRYANSAAICQEVVQAS